MEGSLIYHHSCKRAEFSVPVRVLLSTVVYNFICDPDQGVLALSVTNKVPIPVSTKEDDSNCAIIFKSVFDFFNK